MIHFLHIIFTVFYFIVHSCIYLIFAVLVHSVHSAVIMGTCNNPVCCCKLIVVYHCYIALDAFVNDQTRRLPVTPTTFKFRQAYRLYLL